MNKLLQQIKRNDERFMSYFNCEETEQNTENLDALYYITQLRISELEALEDIMKEKASLFLYSKESNIKTYAIPLSDFVKIIREIKKIIKN